MSDQNAALFDKLDGFYVTKSEHDWLERRFFNMTEKEKILFQGAMELEKPQEIGHVMRIASQLDCYDLFYGAGDEAALGKFVMESIECSSDAARPFLNAEHLGPPTTSRRMEPFVTVTMCGTSNWQIPS